MVEKRYDWINGAKLEDHSRCKHKIIQEYFPNYLTIRCIKPQQQRFRLAIVDGFSGGGRYECGELGSPLIFLEELRRTTEKINIRRVTQGFSKIEIECLLIFNDLSRDAINLLQDHVAPLYADIMDTCPQLHVHIEYLNHPFEVAYQKINSMLEKGRYRSVLFNLDQCGDTHVKRETILDIMRTHPSVEIFYTFMINSLLAFLQRSDPDQLGRRLAHLGLIPAAAV